MILRKKVTMCVHVFSGESHENFLKFLISELWTQFFHKGLPLTPHAQKQTQLFKTALSTLSGLADLSSHCLGFPQSTHNPPQTQKEPQIHPKVPPNSPRKKSFQIPNRCIWDNSGLFWDSFVVVLCVFDFWRPQPPQTPQKLTCFGAVLWCFTPVFYSNFRMNLHVGAFWGQFGWQFWLSCPCLGGGGQFGGNLAAFPLFSGQNFVVDPKKNDKITTKFLAGFWALILGHPYFWGPKIILS